VENVYSLVNTKLTHKLGLKFKEKYKVGQD